MNHPILLTILITVSLIVFLYSIQDVKILNPMNPFSIVIFLMFLLVDVAFRLKDWIVIRVKMVIANKPNKHRSPFMLSIPQEQLKISNRPI
jgi:uncharacterized Tic20 family protein